MTKKRYLIVSLVILALFLTACRTADIDEPRESIYRTGTDGLRLMFPTNTPKEIYENDYDVRMIVEVRNKGAFPQSDEIDELGPSIGKLWVGGYDKNILQITSRSQSDISPGVTLDSRELEGKSVYNREGGYSAAELVMRVLDLPDGMPYYRPRLISSTLPNWLRV
ncbi:MAG: hypothetical protein U9O94_10370 [Nanoarchaeota archaeon]|nr:hypothetical protein [Nanoarchaeota archaeon]